MFYIITKMSGQWVWLKHDPTGHANFYSNNSDTVTLKADAISNSTSKEGSFLPFMIRLIYPSFFFILLLKYWQDKFLSFISLHSFLANSFLPSSFQVIWFWAHKKCRITATLLSNRSPLSMFRNIAVNQRYVFTSVHTNTLCSRCRQMICIFFYLNPTQLRHL